jgi:sigma-E factor negative regulatory protein RseB
MNPEIRQFFQAGLLAAISSVGHAGGAEEARHWLERMASAMNHMSYQGTFVYVRGDSVDTMRITHVVDENGLRERLYSVTGPQREVIRDRSGVRCVLSDDNAVMRDPVVTGAIFPDLPIDDLSSQDGSYSFDTGGAARIGGHKGLRVTIVPGDEFRYGYDLWLEENTGLLLKWVLFDADKNALAKLVFTELKLGSDIDLKELESSTPSQDFIKLETGMPEHQVVTRASPKWQPAKLPPGFRLAAHSHEEREGENVFEHLVYSDGLASVSVYIEKLEAASNSVQGLSQIGTANAFSRSLGSRQVTVIGEVPAATVVAIGESFSMPAAAR